MDNIDLEKAAKVAGGGGVLAIILNRIFGRRRSKAEQDKLDFENVHATIEFWKKEGEAWKQRAEFWEAESGKWMAIATERMARIGKLEERVSHLERLLVKNGINE
jgi:hypothetical protein